MKTVLTTYWKIFAALLVIFMSGSGFGYFAAKQVPCAGSLQGSLPDARKTEEWPERTMEKLRGALDLTDEQAAQIRAIVAGVGGKIFQERDRAMLQISLQVLEMHDSMEEYLNEEQKNKLARSRKKMQLHIEERFSSLIDVPKL